MKRLFWSLAWYCASCRSTAASRALFVPAPSSPRPKIALWATSGSVSWLNLLRVSRMVSWGLETETSARASGTDRRITGSETLSKFSHDTDPEVAHNAIFGLGLLGAGTNNARLAAVLRQLAQYHAKDQNNLFMVRIAQ